MRKLALFSILFAVAALLCAYFIAPPLMPYFAAFSALLTILGLLLHGDKRLAVMLCCAGLTAGFLWCFGYNALFVKPANAYISQSEALTLSSAGYSEKTDYGSRVYAYLKTDGIVEIKTLVCFLSGDVQLAPGDTFTAQGKLSSTFELYGKTSSTACGDKVYLSLLCSDPPVCEKAGFSIRWVPQYAAHALKSKISQIFPDELAGFMQALVTGDKTLLENDTETQTALSDAGISHIVAVSGMHVAFLMGCLSLLTRRKRILSAVCLPVLFLFMAIVGFSPSVTRAGIMYTLVLIAPLLKRETDPLTSLSFALLIILLINPYAAADIGLQLSFAAVLGILLFSSRLFDAAVRQLMRTRAYSNKYFKKALRAILSALSVTLGAMAFTVPLTALHFSTVSLIAPISNLLIIWAVSIAFCLGIAAILLGFLFTPAGRAAALIAGLPARYILFSAKAAASVPFASVSTENIYIILWLSYVYLIIIAALYFKARLRQLLIPGCTAVLFLCCVLIASVTGTTGSCMTVTALDVEQGQCLFISRGSYDVVVDCGSSSGEDAAKEAKGYMAAQGIDSIEMLVLTHYHADHVNGVCELMRSVPISCIAAPDISLSDSEYGAEIYALAQELGIDIMYNVNTAAVSEMSLTFFPPFGGETENERCLSLLCSEGSFDVLVTGDMDSSGEIGLITSYDLPDIEVLIVGHHGSKYSSCSDFLSAVTPEVGIISVGENDYGHPTQEALSRLSSASVAVMRTDTDGTVTVTSW